MSLRLRDVGGGAYAVGNMSAAVCSPDDVPLSTTSEAFVDAGWRAIIDKILLCSKISGDWCGLSLNRLADELSRNVFPDPDQLAEKLSCIKQMENSGVIVTIKLGGLWRPRVSVVCPTPRLIGKLHSYCEHGLLAALAPAS